jgi:YggT family protein
MIIVLFIQIIQAIAWLVTVAVIADIVVSYFLSPDHPIRSFLDRFIQPLLRPIQRILPTFGGLDFSPFVLLLLVQLVESVLISLISMFR